MKRTLVTLLMSAAVAIAAPSVALATHHKHHHSRHHHSARTHRGVRHKRFGKSDQGPSSNSQQAGTVTSFANGVLTITLNDGTTVSGAVTDQTELDCMAPAQNQGDNGGDDNGGAMTNSRNDGGGGSSSGSGDDNGGDSGSGDDNGGGDDGNQMCSTAALTPGTPVAEANLEISSTGASWDKVELITASSSSSNDN